MGHKIGAGGPAAGVPSHGISILIQKNKGAFLWETSCVYPLWDLKELQNEPLWNFVTGARRPRTELKLKGTRVRSGVTKFGGGGKPGTK